MRPVRLEIDGFTCFRTKQVVDFAPLGLFAIAGPTGAGKSSLLDAMVFALYGEIPRVGKQGVSEFIALGRDSMSVVFTFAVGTDRYRVARVGYRAATRPTRVQLERAVGDAWRPVADSVRGVGAAVTQILGLDHETFQQAVLLPQGQFSRFLKASPGDQREILRNLLRAGIYRELGKAAGARSSQLAAEAEALRRRLEADFAGVSEAAVAALEARHGAVRAQVDAEAQALHHRRTALDALTARAGAWDQVRAQDRTLAALAAENGSVDAARRELDAAIRANQVAQALTAAEAAQAALRAAEAQAETHRAAAAQAQEIAEAARCSLAAAERNASACTALEERLATLNQAVAMAAAVRDALDRLAREEDQCTAAAREAATQGTALAAISESLAGLEAGLHADDAALQLLGHDPDHHEALAALQGLGAEVRAARLAVLEAQSARDRASREAADADARLGHADPRWVAASAALAAAQAEAVAARAALAAQELHHRAQAVRTHLVPGAPCPVCEQRVGTVPGGEPPADLSEAHARVRVATTRLDDAQAAAAAAQTARAVADDGARRARDHHAEAVAALGRRERERQVLARTLAEAPALPAGDDPPEVRLAAAVATANQLAREHARRVASRTNAAAAVDRERTALAVARTRLDAATKQQVEAAHRVDLARGACERIQRELRGLVGDVDPEAERHAVSARVRSLREALDDARTKAMAAHGALAVAEAACQAAERARVQADAVSNQATREAERAAAAGAFADLAAARAAIRTGAEQAALQERIDDWTQRRDRAQTLRREASGQAGDAPVSADEVRRERREVDAEDVRLGEARTELGRWEATLATVRERREVQRSVAADHERVVGELRWYEQLARDLRTDAFEKWLLDGTFRSLVAGASVRLLEMSGRYTLDYRDDEFWVVDHDHARELRKADTLSGGETFLASLCLALELSAQVLRAAGGVHLDSLFVDEGFGTLDPETLDTVASAIETLGEGDRMVGIITHVAELTARLPARVRVTRGANGSSVSVETG